MSTEKPPIKLIAYAKAECGAAALLEGPAGRWWRYRGDFPMITKERTIWDWRQIEFVEEAFSTPEEMLTYLALFNSSADLPDGLFLSGGVGLVDEIYEDTNQ